MLENSRIFRGVEKGDFVIDSVDGLWKAYDNSFMVRVKTLNMSKDITEGIMIKFAANAELAGGRLPFADGLMMALEGTDLYSLMPSRPGKCMTVVDCMCPTVTGGCLIHGRVTNGMIIKPKNNNGSWGKGL